MNKYLITAALASALALTACGKKEEAASETATEEVKPADEAKPAEATEDRAEKSMEKMGEWGDHMKKDEEKKEEPKAEEKKDEEKKADAGTPEEARQLAENTISQTPETETKQQ